MNKLLIIPMFFLTMCAPAPVTPPANALEVEEELMWDMIERIQNYRPSKQITDPDDTINSALMEFENGSNDTPKQEVMLQLPSN